MPTVNAVHLDTSGWQPVDRRRRFALWSNDYGDTLTVMIGSPPGGPGVPAVGDPRNAIHGILAVRASGGTTQVLAVERRTVAGVPTIVTLLRSRCGTGWTHEAMVLLPFVGFTIAVIVTAPEHGTTGAREALGHAWAHIETGDHATPLTAEQEQMLDAILPAHPHARVRVYLDELLGSLTLGPELAGALTWPPTRLPTVSGALELRDGCFLRRSTGGRLVGRFPLGATGAPRVEVKWSPTLLAISALGVAGAILAVALLGGWWAVAGAGVGAVLLLLGAPGGWKLPWIVLDTPSGALRWSTHEMPETAEAFCALAASLIPPAKEEPCPPSS